jgi:hypothetical protein
MLSVQASISQAHARKGGVLTDRCLSLFFSTSVPSQRVSLFVTRPLTTNAAQMVRVVSHANVDEEEEVGG